MPAKPSWFNDLDRIIGELEALPRPFVDRTVVETLLGVGRRRAQQILGPAATGRVGSSAVADRDALVARLRKLARGDEVHYERARRRRVAEAIAGWRRDRVEKPQLLVEAPKAVARQGFEDLPAGIRLERGRLTVEFEDPRQALEKLLALTMAIANDFNRFEEEV